MEITLIQTDSHRYLVKHDELVKRYMKVATIDDGIFIMLADKNGYVYVESSVINKLERKLKRNA